MYSHSEYSRDRQQGNQSTHQEDSYSKRRRVFASDRSFNDSESYDRFKSSSVSDRSSSNYYSSSSSSSSTRSQPTSSYGRHYPSSRQEDDPRDFYPDSQKHFRSTQSPPDRSPISTPPHDNYLSETNYNSLIRDRLYSPNKYTSGNYRSSSSRQSINSRLDDPYWSSSTRNNSSNYRDHSRYHTSRSKYSNRDDTYYNKYKNNSYNNNTSERDYHPYYKQYPSSVLRTPSPPHSLSSSSSSSSYRGYIDYSYDQYDFHYPSPDRDDYYSALASAYNYNYDDAQDQQQQDKYSTTQSHSTSSYSKASRQTGSINMSQYITSLDPKNNYSQHFVDTGERPQNFIRDAEVDNRLDEYPKLKELVRLKDKLIREQATAPMYFKCDLKTFDLTRLGTKFDVILIDPPWQEYTRRAVGSDPPEFWTFAEMMNLRIDTIAESPSFIFLWCGSEEGLEQGRLLLKQWGFRRCEDIVWLKTNSKPLLQEQDSRKNPQQEQNNSNDQNNIRDRNEGCSKSGMEKKSSILHHTKEHCLME